MEDQLFSCPHPTILKRGCLKNLPTYLPQSATRIALITTPNVYHLYGKELVETFDWMPLMIPDGERAKSLTVATECWEQFKQMGLDRNSVVIALGGGCVGDLAGFVTSCYMRGLSLIQIPTTLLAMVDASIGGKNGVNVDHIKNLIGTFYQPSLVLIDPNFLQTLPPDERRAGMAEVIKHAVIGDEKLFEQLEKGPDQLLDPIIARAVAIKGQIVCQDPHDQGTRARLNYGHTFAHAFETLSQFEIPHGYAVAMGMHCASYLAEELNLTDSAFRRRQQSLLEHWGLPTSPPLSFTFDQLLQAMHSDKKVQNDKLKFILPIRIGEVDIVKDVPDEAVQSAFKKAQSEGDV